jgi:hypothetical protein
MAASLLPGRMLRKRLRHPLETSGTKRHGTAAKSAAPSGVAT